MRDGCPDREVHEAGFTERDSLIVQKIGTEAFTVKEKTNRISIMSV